MKINYDTLLKLKSDMPKDSTIYLWIDAVIKEVCSAVYQGDIPASVADYLLNIPYMDFIDLMTSIYGDTWEETAHRNYYISIHGD